MQRKRPLRQEAVENALTSSATRRILAHCIRQARPVKDLSHEAQIPLASAYRQVKALVDHGILVVERSAMTADGKAYDLYRSRVRMARIEVQAERVDVAWEVNAPIEDRLAHMWGQLGR